MSIFKTAVLVAVALIAIGSRPSAHVLDQYLQASRLDLSPDRVTLELDLTPGIEIAPRVFFEINTDRDGAISRAEGRAYANRVLEDLDLAIDDRRQSLVLLDCSYPSYDEMRAGTGVIRLRAVASHQLAPGRHRVWYRNRHQPERSAYLVNALMPSASHVTLGPPQRDALQQQFALDYSWEPGIGRAQNPGER